MSKKNKSKSLKLQKLEQAQHKNSYLKKIKETLCRLGYPQAYKLISDADLEVFFLSRLRPIKLIADHEQSCEIIAKDLKLVNKLLAKHLQDTQVEVGPRKIKFSMYDFNCYVNTIYLYWCNVDKFEGKNAQKFHEMVDLFDDNYQKLKLDFYEKVDEYLHLISWICSESTTRILSFQMELPENGNMQPKHTVFYNNYVMSFTKPQSHILTIDGNPRRIFRIGAYKFCKINWLEITPEILGEVNIMGNLSLKIYIQIHVLERIKERLGQTYLEQSNFLILISILNHEIIRADDGDYLFTLVTENIKLGYLKATRIGDILLFRTFLFLTNNGTPEGKKLSQLLHIQKEDKKYLGIDKLSTYINSDIEQNEQILEIFKQAGCAGLFELKKRKKPNAGQTFQYAEYLSEYLCLKQKEKEEPKGHVNNQMKQTVILDR